MKVRSFFIRNMEVVMSLEKNENKNLENKIEDLKKLLKDLKIRFEDIN